MTYCQMLYIMLHFFNCMHARVHYDMFREASGRVGNGITISVPGFHGMTDPCPKILCQKNSTPHSLDFFPIIYTCDMWDTTS